MKDDTSDKVSEITQRLSRYEAEELESRFEMASIGNSQCTSTCGTEAR